MVRYKNIKIFTGNANPQLASEITEYLGMELSQASVTSFSDGEIRLSIGESVRGADCYIIQPTCTPVNDNLMELLIMIDALRRASAKRITAVLPYYGYARQDRKSKARDPITAKLIANLITQAGARRVLAVDLHAGQIQGFFDIPVDHLNAAPLLSDYFKRRLDLKDVVVISPDIGGVGRSRALAESLHIPLAIIDKRRPQPNVAEIMHIIGDVKDKRAIMLDDIIDTGGTIALGAETLLEFGAREVFACCTHAVLSGSAIQRLQESVLREIIVTNTIPLPKDKQIEKIKTLSIAPLIGEAIIRIHEDISVSKLFV
jgi:ribose-phosphate pyrophosphokinase